MAPRNMSARQRFYVAATRWSAGQGVDNQFLIDAATHALASGVDSPTLRELAGMSSHDDSEGLRALLGDALAELMLPHPGGLEPSDVLADDGGVVPRTPAEAVRFEIASADVYDRFQVLVFVDGIEMTSRAAGLGMAPSSLFVPENLLVATGKPRIVPIARCECGEYGCGVTDVRILRQGAVVHWDWLHETPTDHGASFDADQYDAEVARIGADHSWERPEDTAHRLILTGADHERLQAEGLTLRWAQPAYGSPSTFRVALQTTDNIYQVFLHLPLDGKAPTEIVGDVLQLLDEPPSAWEAEFHATLTAVTDPPAIAGTRWSRADFGRPRRAT
ncbi:hypothetical protein GCM10028784_00670 [Myceligenerans cantabricum]